MMHPCSQAHAPVILAPRQRKQVDYKGQVGVVHCSQSMLPWNDSTAHCHATPPPALCSKASGPPLLIWPPFPGNQPDLRATVILSGAQLAGRFQRVDTSEDADYVAPSAADGEDDDDAFVVKVGQACCL